MKIPESVIKGLLTKAARARNVCKIRHDEFVMKAKQEINALVRKRLSVAILERMDRDDFKGSKSFADFDMAEQESSSSDASDPLGTFAT